MVAYSFKNQFVHPIQLGLTPGKARPGAKRHTIRADGLRPHARPGQLVQLYCGQRTPSCFLIGEGRCTAADKIAIHFRARRRSDWAESWTASGRWKIDRPSQLDQFAITDGFQDWDHLRDFWRTNHPGIADFEGTIVYWEPL